MTDQEQSPAGDRVKIAIQGLDEQMDGGIPRGFVTLVSGPAGSLKSTIAFNLLIEHLRAHPESRALYLSLEQDRRNMLEHIESMGMSIEGLEDRLVVSDLTKLRANFKDDDIHNIDWFGNIENGIKEHKDRLDIEFVVIDSLDALTVLSETANPRNRIFNFFQRLRELDMTSFLISEMPTDRLKFGRHGVESFLADGVIHVDLRREGNNVGLYIGVVKMRKTRHTRKYFPLLIDQHGSFSIVTKG